MKQILVSLVALALFPAVASAAPSSSDQAVALCGWHGACASYVMSVVNNLASPFANNTYVEFRNAANLADISVLKVDGTDDTVLNADSGDVIKLSVAGTAEVTIADGSVTVADSEVILSTSGRTLAIQEATAGAKCMGTVTATGTNAVTVSTTCATTGSRILLTRSSAPSGTAICWQTNIVNGVSFDVDCSGAETGTFDWFILHEAA